MHGTITPNAPARAAQELARIRVVDLVKTYKRQSGGGMVVPVDHITTEVAVDEMLVLLGPSGCGKTTLLRCVAGLERPDSGEIYINDQLVFSSKKNIFLPPNKRPVSMVFQSYALWPHMTIFENVAYPLRSRGMNSADVRPRVERALGVVGLDALAKQYPGQISGGQQQRVALARAVVSETGVVLFDEPLSNVDAKVREQLRLEIRRMQRDLKFSALYVTHDQHEAMAVADRIAVLGSGSLEQIGTAEAIYDRPSSIYVANFIGGANIWSAKASRVEPDAVWVDTAIGTLKVERGSALMRDTDALAVGDAVSVVARPESVVLSGKQPEGENAFPCTVDTRIFLGAHVEYVLARNGERIRANLATREPHEEGSDAFLSISPRHIRLLKDQGGARP